MHIKWSQPPKKRYWRAAPTYEQLVLIRNPNPVPQEGHAASSPQPFNSAPTWLHSLTQAHQSRALELPALLSAFAPSFRNQETWRRLVMKRQQTERTLFCPTNYGGPDSGTTLLNILKIFMSHSLKNEVRSGEAFQFKVCFHSWNECIRGSDWSC